MVSLTMSIISINTAYTTHTPAQNDVLHIRLQRTRMEDLATLTHLPPHVTWCNDFFSDSLALDYTRQIRTYTLEISHAPDSVAITYWALSRAVNTDPMPYVSAE